MLLSKLTNQIAPSGIRDMFNKSLEYTDVISFTVGQPDFTASGNVVEAGCDAIRRGDTKYTANAGIPELRAGIAAALKRSAGLEYDPDRQVAVTTGAMGAVYLTLKVLLDPGDEVIVPAPYYGNYDAQIKMNGGVPVYVVCKEENDFVLETEDLKRAITPKTKVIFLNSPCNPTGSVIGREALRQIAEIAKEKDLLVISDEVYNRIVYDGEQCESIACLPGMRERTVVINSFSKTYAMTGWRIGYAAGPEEIVWKVAELQEYVASCAAMPCQYAALEALEGSQEHFKHMLSEYERRRNYLVGRLNAMKGVSCQMPKGAFYAFPNISAFGKTSEEFAYALLDRQQVATAPGNTFGACGEGYLRLSYATSMENIEKGMDRMDAFVRSLISG
jgi:aminotransferase